MKCDDHSGARDIRDIRDIFQGFYDHSFDGDHRRLLTATDQDSSNRSNRQGHPHAWEGTAHQLRHFVGAKGMVCIYIYIHTPFFYESRNFLYYSVAKNSRCTSRVHKNTTPNNCEFGPLYIYIYGKRFEDLNASASVPYCGKFQGMSGSTIAISGSTTQFVGGDGETRRSQRPNR